MTVITSPRMDVPHFAVVKSDILSNVIIRNQKKTLGVTTVPSLDAKIKYDGYTFRFGKDSEGLYFVESGRSGPIYDPNDFVEYTEARIAEKPHLSSDQISEMRYRAESYRLTSIEVFEWMESVQGEVDGFIPDNTKFHCEILDRRLRSPEGRYVHIAYPDLDPSKTHISVWMFTTADGSKMTNEQILYRWDWGYASTHEWSRVHSKINFLRTDIQTQRVEINGFDSSAPATVAEHILETVRKELTVYGPEFEGIIVRIPSRNGNFTAKIINPEFREIIARNKRKK